MTRLRVHNLAVSLDGFATGEGRTVEAPFGHAGGRLMQWFFPTRTFATASGHEREAEGSGTAGVDDAFAATTNLGIGAEIMGRGKFGPQVGPWPDEEWRGWWGDEPPFRTPVVVLTHHERPDLVLGETTFHFRDLAPIDALALAAELAGGSDVRLGGGPTTVRAFLEAGLVDEMHLVLVPVVLGRGVPLWEGLEGVEEQFAIESVASPSGVVHQRFTRRR